MEESTSLGVKDLDELQKDLLATSPTTKADTAVNNDPKTEGEGISTNVITAVSSAIIIDGKKLCVEDVMEMKKKIDDLTTINESRDKKISEVGIFLFILEYAYLFQHLPTKLCFHSIT